MADSSSCMAVVSVPQAHDHQSVELREKLLVYELGLLGDGTQAHSELAALPGYVLEARRVAACAQNPLRLFNGDEAVLAFLLALFLILFVLIQDIA